jgi:DNA modification methylase
LGEHRLLCGDSSKPEDVDRLLDGQPIHLVNTDPPYNVKVEPRSNNAIAAGLSSFQATSAARRDGSMTHHQGFDLARDPEKAKRTTRKLRAKDRPLANDFVSDDEFDRLLAAWFGNIARVLLTVAMLELDVVGGAPANADGTVNLVHYAAWLIWEAGRGD